MAVASTWFERVISASRYTLRPCADREHGRLRRVRGCTRDRQRPQRHLRLLMETDQIEQLLACDPLMCHYTVTAKTSYPKSSKHTRSLSFVICTVPFNQENIVSPCTWMRSATTSTRTDNHRNTSSLRTL